MSTLSDRRRLVADVVETVRLLVGAVGLLIGGFAVAGGAGDEAAPLFAIIIFVTTALTVYLHSLDVADR